MQESAQERLSHLITFNFHNIDVYDVKYLPSSFDDNVLFVLPPLSMGVGSAYGYSMNDMDKMCDGHPWCKTTLNIQNKF